jgi:hypothetical protein
LSLDRTEATQDLLFRTPLSFAFEGVEGVDVSISFPESTVPLQVSSPRRLGPLRSALLGSPESLSFKAQASADIRVVGDRA